MRFKVSFIFLFTLIVMSQSIRVIQSKNYCNIISNGCVNNGKDNETEKECNKSEVCHGLHSYQCDKLRCAVNKAECDEFLKTKKIIDSESLKTDSYQKRNFKRFLGSIKNCELKPYSLKKNDICLKKKETCFATIKGEYLVFGLGFNKKPTLVRKQCSCQNTNHPFECYSKFCALNMRSCKEFNRIGLVHSKKDLKIRHCEYN